MKNFNQVKLTALESFSMVSFAGHISTDEEYTQVLALMEELIEEYDIYIPLIELLEISIEYWEDNADEFTEFNARIDNLDDDVAIFRVSIEQ